MSLRRALKSIIEWKNVSILYDSSLIKFIGVRLKFKRVKK